MYFPLTFCYNGAKGGVPMKKQTGWVIAITLAACTAMALVDGVWQPPYALKSAVKILLFLGLPLVLSLRMDGIAYRELFRPAQKGVLAALGLGVGLYALILGAYFLIGRFFDFSAIVGNLSANAGVTRDNFLFVSLYISFVNSLLEEFFFRGFVFTNLKRHRTRRFAYLFSAAAFSLYHVAMMVGWFSPLLFMLVMAGLMVGGMIFNYMNEKLETIYCSWLTHMFANFAINTIGFLLMG